MSAVPSQSLPTSAVSSVSDWRASRGGDLVAAAGFLGTALLFVAVISHSFVDLDLWHGMALIRESLREGHLLTHDVFAYTPTLNPVVHHEWGAGAIAYFLGQAFGSPALLVLKYVLALSAGVVCTRAAMSQGADTRLLPLLAPFAIYMAQLGYTATVRAQAYSFLFAAVALLLFQRDRRGERAWQILWIVLFPVWVNLHGGFVVGLGFLGLHCLEQILHRGAYRHLLALLAVSAFEVFINPYGSAYLSYLGRALPMSRWRIGEWMTIWHGGTFITVTVALSIAIAAYAVFTTGIRQARGLLILIAASVEGVLHIKLLPLFAVAWICQVPPLFQKTRAGQWLLRYLYVNPPWIVVLAVAIGTLSVRSAVAQRFWSLEVPQTALLYPVGAVDYLGEQKFAGKLFVPFEAGGYVSWRLYPNVKVSVDSRYEVAYPDDVTEGSFRFFNAEPGWLDVLARYPPDLVLVRAGSEGLIDPHGAAISRGLVQSGWTQSYRDKQFELFARPGLVLPFEDRSSTTPRGVWP